MGIIKVWERKGEKEREWNGSSEECVREEGLQVSVRHAETAM